MQITAFLEINEQKCISRWEENASNLQSQLIEGRWESKIDWNRPHVRYNQREWAIRRHRSLAMHESHAPNEMLKHFSVEYYKSSAWEWWKGELILNLCSVLSSSSPFVMLFKVSCTECSFTWYFFQLISDFRIKLTVFFYCTIRRYVNDLCKDWLTSAPQ